MNASKDYYQTLRVLPNAEDAVIRAAYKALALLYHPDRNPKSNESTHQYMALINEAYKVLSDPQKRHEYDAQRRKNEVRSSDYFENENDPIPNDDPFQRDWEIASKFYPDLNKIASSLARLSMQVAYAFKSYLIESKAFNDRVQIANRLKTQFLQLYFGNNGVINDFAEELILAHRHDAARALNQAIRVLGTNADPSMVINGIRTQFPDISASIFSSVAVGKSSKDAVRNIFASLKNDHRAWYPATKEWIEKFGGTITLEKHLWMNTYTIHFDGHKYVIDLAALPWWTRTYLLPKLDN
jgi:curved DNA-binding protein CbpA